jgi:hypothetical protein
MQVVCEVRTSRETAVSLKGHLQCPFVAVVV